MFGRFSNTMQTFFYSSRNAIKKGYSSAAKTLEKYPKIISQQTRTKLLEESQVSQNYVFCLLSQKNSEVGSPTSEINEYIMKKYPKKVDSNEIENTLSEAQANKKFSIY